MVIRGHIMFRTINKRIQYPEMKLNNIAIERVSKFKFLGIWLDEYLNWNHHISHISISYKWYYEQTEANLSTVYTDDDI